MRDKIKVTKVMMGIACCLDGSCCSNCPYQEYGHDMWSRMADCQKALMQELCEGIDVDVGDEWWKDEENV